MKRWFVCILVLLLLLSGCAAGPAETTADPAGETGEGQQLAEPGLYDPQSLIEQQTNGAVRAYPLGASNCGGIGFMGEDVLLFSSGPAQDKTTVTRLTGVNCTKGLSVELEGNIYPGSPQLRISNNRLAYYSAAGNCVIFLNANLQETERVVLPGDMLGTPVLSEDLSTVFYCTATEIRGLDMESGISRLIRQQARHAQAVTGTLFSDTVLECFITEQGGSCYTEFISASDGKTLGKDETMAYLYAHGDTYFLCRTEGYIQELVWGKKGGTAQCLMPAEDAPYLYSALEMDAVLSVVQEENRVGLALYRLTGGRKIAALELSGLPAIYAIAADPTEKAMWFLSYEGEQGLQTLYRWDVTVSAVTDDTVYTGLRYTRENPDAEGLRRCQEQADSLGHQYGVGIFLGDAVKKPTDYSFVSEYQVAAFQKGLDSLEQALARFPEGFFKTLDKNGQLQIGLVRDMTGLTQNAVSDAIGLQYWLDGKACIALNICDGLEQTFYHELSHVLDAHIIGNSLAYDDWEDLNPKGFQYDGNYQDYLNRNDNTYIEGGKRAFIDYYSMTYAKEDRARIFEYAMMEGNAECFSSAAMQSKLRQICIGIREAFDLEKDERSFPWEQYLMESLAYQKK